MSHFRVYLSSLAAGAALLCAGATQEAQAASNQPFMTSDGDTIAAFIDGPHCADTVASTFRSRSRKHYETSTVVGRLMNNVSSLLGKQCPTLELVQTRGYAGDKEVYIGVSSKETGWEVMNSLRPTSGLLGETLKKGQQAEAADYVAHADFVPVSEVADRMGGDQSLCFNYDNTSCTFSARFTDISDSKGTAITRQFNNAEGDIASITAEGSIRDGLWCVDVAHVDIHITGEGIVEGSKRQVAMQDMLRERMKSDSPVVCTGYHDKGGVLSSTQFDSDGYKLRLPVDATILADTTPPLRIE